MATTILLARHGETDWNREGRWQGWADLSLNGTGHDQAWNSPRVSPTRTSMPSIRATCAERSRPPRSSPRRTSLPVVTDPGLREIDVGQWSGLTRAEIAERFPLGNRPGGETREQHSVRVLASVERIARAHPGERILVVAHGGCLRALQRHLDDDVSHPIPNCSVYEIHFRDDGFIPV